MKPKNLSFSPKERGMSSAAEARSYLDDLVAIERAPLKLAFPRIARMVGLSTRRVRALWLGEARRIEADEIKALRAAAAKKQVSDASNYAARLEAMAARLAATDADFHAPEIEAARALSRRLRGLTGGGV